MTFPVPFRVFLFVVALMLSTFGGWRVLDPIGFYAFSGVDLAADPGLLSEARGAGGVVVGFAVLILAGVFQRRLAWISALSAAILFLSYGIGRSVGLILDGNPGAAILQGIASEFLFGTLALVGLVWFARHDAGDHTG